MIEFAISCTIITAIGLILCFCPKLFFIFCRTFFINEEEPSVTFLNITKMIGIIISIIGLFSLVLSILNILNVIQ